MNFELQSTLDKTAIETPAQRLRRKPLLMTGLIFIILSFGIFLLQEWGTTKTNGDSFGVFFLNYGLAASYLFMLVFKKLFRFKDATSKLEYLLLFLVLGLISDFSLNREMNLFLPSADWLSVYLIVVSVAMISYAFRFLLPRPLQYVMVFLMGAGLVLFGYYALYLAPLYFFGLVGAIAIGIGLHVFIPLCAGFALFAAANRITKEDATFKRPFWAGVVFPVLLTFVFLSMWQVSNRQINQIINSYQVQDQQDLPRWVALSQQMSSSPLFERVIQSDLVFQAASGNFDFFRLPNFGFDEIKRHDPLIVLATLFLGKPELDHQERIKILESQYDARHQTQQRLWSGDHLTTSNVITQAQIFPQYRMSYTEKILNVRNHRPTSWGQEEAIYTFYLPEGSVVTSLSLWINGKEEKGYLTTRSKADSAYTTIVGVESRDPSVVHWQEGNTVSVRVFPCTPQESRRFKIGVTSPLRLQNGELVYENIYFDGPSAESATETTVILLEESGTGIDLPSDFKPTGNNRFERFSSYTPGWDLRFPAPKLSQGSFAFAGHTYQMQEQKQSFESFVPSRVYLDVNRAWSDEELSKVWKATEKAKVYAYLNGTMTLLTPDNKNQVLDQLKELRFTLFPVHLVKDPEQALIISKSSGPSPNLKDIKDSRFAADFAKTASKQAPVRFFNIGSSVSPYTKTLKELQLLHYTQGSPDDIARLLSQKKFVQPNLDPNTVVLAESGASIVRTNAPANQLQAPDHLLRLFAYNHLLSQIGKNYFQEDYLEENFISEAAQANIVSPLSSLVVLETKADYERFDIKENLNSLGNASMQSAGAVPEPHEWLLIFLVIAIVTVLVLKPQLFS